MMVAFFHFTRGNPAFLTEGWLYAAGRPGWAGVDVFFVISGFIIPYSLLRSNYRIINYPTFLIRRIVRLDPPYLVSLVFIILLGYISSRTPGFAGHPFSIEWSRLFLHVGYLNGIFGVPWYSDVFWTLAIELQFYLLIGLVFPLLPDRRSAIGTSVLVLFAVAGVTLSNAAYLPAWIFPFLLGTVAFRYKAGVVSMRLTIVQLVLASAGVWVTLGALPWIEATLAVALILLVDLPSIRVLEFFGAISYPLYLVHIAVGGRVINLATRLHLSSFGQVAAVCAAFAASIAAAFILHRFVETPAHVLARRFSWRRAAGTEVSVPA